MLSVMMIGKLIKRQTIQANWESSQLVKLVNCSATAQPVYRCMEGDKVLTGKVHSGANVATTGG